jgi:stage IV sporulation protein FB
VEQELEMKWSWKLGSVAGIGLFVHWSFLILPALIGFEAYAEGGWMAAAQAVVFILAVFGCVLLHELGHALMARRFGIGTRDITLLPIGGVARLERMPRRPLEELAVALAGPAVNVVIAAALLAALVALGRPWLPSGNPLAGSLPVSLLWANVALVVFNMIPAFPMDGGRVLRSLLALVVSHERATLVAATIGQIVAVGFGIYGVYEGQWMLVLVALFVFVAARAELQASRATARFNGWSVRDVMLRHFNTVPAESPLEDVAQTALFTGQRSFPVVDGNRLVGMLDQQQVLAALSAGGGARPVTDVMRRDYPLIDEGDPLDNTYLRMQSAGLPGVPVFSAGRLVGILPLERLRQWLTFLAAHADFLPGRETLDASWRDVSRA